MALRETTVSRSCLTEEPRVGLVLGVEAAARHRDPHKNKVVQIVNGNCDDVVFELTRHGRAADKSKADGLTAFLQFSDNW